MISITRNLTRQLHTVFRRALNVAELLNDTPTQLERDAMAIEPDENA